MFWVSQTVNGQEFVIESTTNESNGRFVEARMAVHETRFELADDLLREVLRTEPQLRLGWAYLAVVDVLLFRDPTVHIAEARKPVEGQPHNERDMVEILARFASGDLAECEELILQFLRTFPDDRFAIHLLGFVYNDSGLFDESIDLLRELIRMHPDFVPAWNHLGYAFMEQGDLTKARAAFEMFFELSPENPSAYDSMAEILAREGDVDRALNLLRRATDLEPRMAFAWMHMGDILFDAGIPDDALLAYKDAMESSVQYGDEFRALVQAKMDEISRDTSR
ncbi:tetratricopeptide repeat protein [Bacteroidota bacterium]